MARKGATNPPPQNQRLKVRFFAAISSAVGGGGRSFSDKTLVDDMMAEDGSSLMKRPIPSLRADEDVCCWKDTGERTVAAGWGTSIAMDREVVLCRALGVTKPVMHATTDRKDKRKRLQFFMMLAMIQYYSITFFRALPQFI